MPVTPSWMVSVCPRVRVAMTHLPIAIISRMVEIPVWYSFCSRGTTASEDRA